MIDITKKVESENFIPRSSEGTWDRRVLGRMLGQGRSRYLITCHDAPVMDMLMRSFIDDIFVADLSEDLKGLNNDNEKPSDRHRGGYGEQMSNELIEKMRGIGRDPNVYENLVKSLAPNIWESDDVKKGK